MIPLTTKPRMSSESHILGESGDAYWHVVSNTNDDVDNTPYSFVNQPYGGLQFKSNTQWRVGISQGSLPTAQSGVNKSKEHLVSYNQLWYKRWSFPEEITTEDESGFKEMYQRLMVENYLTKDGYRLIMNTLPKQTCRFDINSLIVNDDGKTYPETLQNFLLHSYNEYPTPFAYFSDTTESHRSYDPHKVILSESYIGISRTDGDVNIFDFDVRRGGHGIDDKDRTTTTAIENGDGGYMQIIRLSRTLATLLGIDNWWCDNTFYPRSQYRSFEKPLPTEHNYWSDLLYLTEFPSSLLFNAKEEKKNAHGVYNRIKNMNIPLIPTPSLWVDCRSEACLIPWKLKLTDRWFSLTFLSSNYDPNSDPIGLKTNGKYQTFTMENYTSQTGKAGYQPFIQTDSNDGEYIDILVVTCNPSAVACKSSSVYNDIESVKYFTSTNIKWLPGCYWGQISINCKYLKKIPYNVTYSLQHPSIISTIISCPFIPDNIYTGVLEKTLEIIFYENADSDATREPFTTTFFELDRPMHHSLTVQGDEQELSFVTTTRYVPDLDKLFTEPVLGDATAISYYTTNGVLLSRTGSPVRLSLFFSQVQNN